MKNFHTTIMLLCSFITTLQSADFTTPEIKDSFEQLRDSAGYVHVTQPAEACLVYPKTVHEIENRVEQTINDIKTIVDALIATPLNEQNKHTMIYTYDRLSIYSTQLGILKLVQYVYPDEKMRRVAAETSTRLSNFYTDHVSMNVDLYNAFKTYYESNATTENLTDFERYFLNELINNFVRSGLNLPEKKRNNVAELAKKITQLEQDFCKNLSEDTSFITVATTQLTDVPLEFIEGLERTPEGNALLYTDYPTHNVIMNSCSNQEIRKRFSKAFKNRAYPKNTNVLDQLIVTRNALAQELGFASFSDLDLSNQMIQTSARAWTFEKDMQQKVVELVKQEFKQLIQDLPEGVTLSPEGKMYPWDSFFIWTHFKKKQYDIDENVLAQYFPLDTTIKGLMSVYEQFFSLKISLVSSHNIWHEDVKLLEIKNAQTNILLGYVFLDMHPRPQKYGRAILISGVPAYQTSDGSYYPGVVTVVCNFTKPTETKPSLLKYNEIATFFHEFGHALHSLLGGTQLAVQSGVKVKRDFVELPSQMLESWLEDRAIVKNISHHYQTGESLPDALLNKKLALITFGSGMFIAGELIYGMVALDYFGPETNKNTDLIWQQYCQLLTPHMIYDPETHPQCNFSHLAGYGAKYYGYLWSNILGQDVFATIEKEGLLNPLVGKRYVDCILSKGGSKDPNQLLVDFLGRQPNTDAFFKKMDL